MYIEAKKEKYQVIVRNQKLYAPIVINGVVVFLLMCPLKSRSANLKVNKGNLPILHNNEVFRESVRRLEFLVNYAKDKMIKDFNRMPIEISGIKYLETERRVALRICRENLLNPPVRAKNV